MAAREVCGGEQGMLSTVDKRWIVFLINGLIADVRGFLTSAKTGKSGRSSSTSSLLAMLSDEKPKAHEEGFRTQGLNCTNG